MVLYCLHSNIGTNQETLGYILPPLHACSFQMGKMQFCSTGCHLRDSQADSGRQNLFQLAVYMYLYFLTNAPLSWTELYLYKLGLSSFS